MPAVWLCVSDGSESRERAEVGEGESWRAVHERERLESGDAEAARDIRAVRKVGERVVDVAAEIERQSVDERGPEGVGVVEAGADAGAIGGIAEAKGLQRD